MWAHVVSVGWQWLAVAGSGWQWLAVVGSGWQCLARPSVQHDVDLCPVLVYMLALGTKRNELIGWSDGLVVVVLALPSSGARHGVKVYVLLLASTW